MNKVKKTGSLPHFLRNSLILVLAVSAACFLALAFFLNRQSASTIRDVSQVYMSGLSEQIASHFDTAITLRLDQLSTLVRTIVSEDVHSDKDQRNALIYNARAREFSHLGFLMEDGSFQMLYGQKLEITDPEPYMRSLSQRESKVAIGTDAAGTPLILLGVPSGHDPLPDYPCLALVAALPVTYISEILALDETENYIYSFIIRRDGSYVIQGAGDDRATYFDSVSTIYQKDA